LTPQELAWAEARHAAISPHPAVGFATRLADHGGRPALLGPDGERVTYAGLADRVAATVDALGRTRRLVLVEGANTVDTVAAYLGALAGGHPVLLAPSDRAGHLEDLVDRYRPDVVVRAAEPSLDERHRGTVHDLHPDLALLLTTSGTTGSPKLVRLSHRNLESNAAAIATYLRLFPDDRAVTSLPLHYCYGLSVLHSHLVAGAGVVLTDLSVTDPCFWARVRDDRVTGLPGVPYTFDLLDRVGFADMDLPHLRYVTQAGGRLAPDRVAYWSGVGRRNGWDLYVMYGQTEATARMAYLPPELAEHHPDAVGKAVPGGAFTLRRPTGARPDDPGELVYHGPNVMLGYAEHPADLALGCAVTELRTGDLATIDDTGLVRIVGRTGRFLKLFGLRIDLDQAEHLLAAEGVTALCTGTDTELVVAVEAPSGEASAAGAAAVESRRIRGLLAAAFGLPLTAVRVAALPAFPRRDNGKPDLAALLPLVTTSSPDADPEAAHDRRGPDGASPVAALYAEVLDLDETAIGPDATFVALGGDSLSYVEVSVALDELLDRVPEAWHLTTVADLEALVIPPQPRSESTGPRAVPEARRPAAPASMETNVVLRAVAIVLIVGTHSGVFLLQGGAHVLLAIAGYNVARFRLAARSTVEHVRRSAASIARIAVPASLWLAFQFTYAEPFTAARALFANNYLGTGLWEYWYLDALVQIMVLVAVAFAVPGVRSFERRHRFGVAFGLLVAATALRYDALDIGSDAHWMYMPDTILWCFALGWAAQRATSVAQRLAVSAVGIVCLVDFFDTGVRGILVGVGLAALIWLPRLPVPRAARPVLVALAAASLWLYLTHWAVVPLRGEVASVLVFALALAAGLVVAALARRVEPRIVARCRRARSDGEPGAPARSAQYRVGVQPAIAPSSSKVRSIPSTSTSTSPQASGSTVIPRSSWPS
jgi:acyl-CoA synthetase (AMP-forming)/AMP-acid ligase II/peptidoglycan/LPS O-acetylase OafA/YrhL/acyl carrier protein